MEKCHMNILLLWRTNTEEENTSQKFRFKNIDGTWNYFSEEINQNELMNKKHKKSLFNFKWYWQFFSCYSYRHCKICSEV